MRQRRLTRKQETVPLSTCFAPTETKLEKEAKQDPAKHSWTLNFLGSFGLFTFVLFVFIKTLYPSVAGGDSGELVAEACHGGIAHPPGYPLFLILTHLFIHCVPIWGDSSRTVAWKANLLNAVLDAFAAVVIYHCVLLWLGQRRRRAPQVSAFTASALFAFSPLIWTYAVGAEVFALNNLFAALLLYLALQYSVSRSFKVAVVGALVSGLALCNQHTIVLFELPIVAWVLYSRRRTLFWREFTGLASAFLIGLTPYAYLPLSAHFNGHDGSWGDLSSLRGFIRHLRRADYGTFRLFSTDKPTEGLQTRLHVYALDLWAREIPLPWVLMPVIFVGMITTWSKTHLRLHSGDHPSKLAANHIGKIVLGMYLFYMIVFHSLANLPLHEGLLFGVHMRFWQQPNVIIFTWLGVGMGLCMDMGFTIIRSLWHKLPQITGAADLTGRVMICFFLVGAQLGTWFSLCDQSDSWYIHNYATAILDPLPSKATLFVNFDLQWTALRYLQQCERQRPDVTLLHLSMMSYGWFAKKHDDYPHLRFPGSHISPFGSRGTGFTLADFLDANSDKHRNMSRTSKKRSKTRRVGGVFFGGKLNYHDQDFHEKYEMIPFGLLDEFQPTSGNPVSLRRWYTEQKSVVKHVHSCLPKLPPTAFDDQTWEWTIARDYHMKRLSWSTFLLESTIAEEPLNVQLLAEATHAMERSYQFEPPQFWNAAANLKNLGLAYAQIVKSNQDFKENAPYPFAFQDSADIGDNPARYKDLASRRMLEVWKEWIALREAKNDPGYSSIASIVHKFLPSGFKRSIEP